MAHYIEQLVNKNGLFYFRATARQRAEAFLRTLGKWPATDKESLTVEATTEQSSAVHIGDTTEMVKEVQK
jgi:N6-adenosine-specific RNA methylase IME4